MNEYEVVWEGRLREIYLVEADSEEDARALWPDDLPVHSEAFGGEVVNVVNASE